MLLSQQTINKLVSLINEETKYRSGPMLVEFFNQFGFNDVYGQGFPSRAFFTAEKLKKLNGSPDIDKCIRLIFAPIEFVSQLSKLDSCIADLNQYLVFDGWIVVRNNTEITFRRETNIDLDSKIANEVNENEVEFHISKVTLNHIFAIGSIKKAHLARYAFPILYVSRN